MITAFWERARADTSSLPESPPEAWAFGATPEQADDLLDLVLSGVKTATASSLWDYQATGDAVPESGELSIVLDGSGSPRAVLRTVDVRIVPFEEVSAEHAHAEGEGDRTLGHWREVHERFWRAHSENPRGFEPGMPVVCELFQVIHPTQLERPGTPAR